MTAVQASAAKRKRTEVEFDIDEFFAKHSDATAEHCILGIDEAGRGPVVGDMVYCAAVVSLGECDDLLKCGVADSKTLDPHARNSCMAKLQRLKTFLPFVKKVTAEKIGEAMTGRTGWNLNTLSHEAAINLIHEATLHCKGKLVAVYVDTVGSPQRYQALLHGRFPHLDITVCPKADAKYPIVSAASIVAKTTRDSSVESLGLDVGSGYPGDPTCARWIRRHVHRFFGYNSTLAPHIRFSWAPIVAIFKEANVKDVTFQQDLDKEALSDPLQKPLSFNKPTARRNPLYTHVLGLHSTADLAVDSAQSGPDDDGSEMRNGKLPWIISSLR